MIIERIIPVAVGVALILCVTLFIFFIVFYNKKIARIQADLDIVSSIAREHLQRQMLNNLSYDIIDNFGNNLFAVRVNLICGVLEPLQQLTEKIRLAPHDPGPAEVHNLLINFDKSINSIYQNVLDAKHPVEAMNTDMIDTSRRLRTNFADNSFLKNLENELKRLTSYSVNKEILGKEYPLGTQKEILLLWICQEALNNIIQHSEAKTLNISIQYDQSTFLLRINDEGIGFDQKSLYKSAKRGKGFENMQKAAHMLNAELDVRSRPSKGTTISIRLETLSN
jgi:signal transduction histidine kinase